MTRLNKDFYIQDVLIVAPNLIGKILVRKLPDGDILRYRITEAEAYRGEEDTACHAHAGKTKRTAILYKEGGCTYIYLCYGMYYLLNVVTGKECEPQAALIRGVEGFGGPGKLTKALKIDKSLHDIDLTTSNDMWIEDDGFKAEYTKTKRVGIDYATEPYKSIEWRFVMKK
jgi:DNA-3-methyladenine glycosylase